MDQALDELYANEFVFDFHAHHLASVLSHATLLASTPSVSKAAHAAKQIPEGIDICELLALLSAEAPPRARCAVVGDTANLELTLPHAKAHDFFHHIAHNETLCSALGLSSLSPIAIQSVLFFALPESHSMSRRHSHDFVVFHLVERLAAPIVPAQSASALSSHFGSSKRSPSPVLVTLGSTVTVQVRLYIIKAPTDGLLARPYHATTCRPNAETISAVRELLEARLQQACVHYMRDHVWTHLAKAKDEAASTRAAGPAGGVSSITPEHVAVLCRFSNMTPVTAVDRSLRELLSQSINWHRALDQLKLFHTGPAHDVGDGPARHLLLFHKTDYEVLLYVRIDPELTSASATGGNNNHSFLSPSKRTSRPATFTTATRDPVAAFLCSRLHIPANTLAAKSAGPKNVVIPDESFGDASQLSLATPLDANSRPCILSEPQQELLSFFVNMMIHWMWRELLD